MARHTTLRQTDELRLHAFGTQLAGHVDWRIRDAAEAARVVARDRFDKTAIDRRAWHEVATAYQQELGRVDRDEASAIDRLLDAAGHRRTRDAFKRGFAEASQERSGPSRLRRD